MLRTKHRQKELFYSRFARKSIVTIYERMNAQNVEQIPNTHLSSVFGAWKSFHVLTPRPLTKPVPIKKIPKGIYPNDSTSIPSLPTYEGERLYIKKDSVPRRKMVMLGIYFFILFFKNTIRHLLEPNKPKTPPDFLL